MSHAPDNASPAAPAREAVVILHGVAINTRFTARLARLIAAGGYEVHNLDYPSRTVPLAELGPRWLAAKLDELGLDRAPRLHFVTHSMGGLIVRGYLTAHRPANLGRVVTIVPPHHGSAVSDALRRLPIIWRTSDATSAPSAPVPTPTGARSRSTPTSNSA